MNWSYPLLSISKYYAVACWWNNSWTVKVINLKVLVVVEEIEGNFSYKVKLDEFRTSHHLMVKLFMDADFLSFHVTFLILMLGFDHMDPIYYTLKYSASLLFPVWQWTMSNEMISGMLRNNFLTSYEFFKKNSQ